MLFVPFWIQSNQLLYLMSTFSFDKWTINFSEWKYFTISSLTWMPISAFNIQFGTHKNNRKYCDVRLTFHLRFSPDIGNWKCIRYFRICMTFELWTVNYFVRLLLHCFNCFSYLIFHLNNEICDAETDIVHIADTPIACIKSVKLICLFDVI